MSQHLPAIPDPSSTPERLARVAGLLGWQMPESGAEVVASYPPCPTFYAPAIIEGPRNALRRALFDRVLLYLQGETLGVGVSEFLRDFATLALAHAQPGEWPVLLFPVLPTAKSPRPFLDAIGRVLGVRLSRADLSLRDATSVGDQILLALCMLRVRVIVVDHAHYLSDVAKAILTYLADATGGARPTLAPQPEQPSPLSSQAIWMRARFCRPSCSRGSISRRYRYVSTRVGTSPRLWARSILRPPARIKPKRT